MTTRRAFLGAVVVATAGGAGPAREIAMPPGPATRADVRDALTAFTGGVIVKMVPVCAVLRRALPA